MRKFWLNLVGSAVLAFGLMSLSPAFAQPDLLPEGPGKAELLSGCISCHGAEVMTTQKRSKTEWDEVMARMMGYGAPSTAEQQKLISDYLLKHYGKAPEGKS